MVLTWFLYNSSSQADIALVNIGPIVVKYWEMDWQLNSKYQSLYNKVQQWAPLTESEIWDGLNRLGSLDFMNFWFFFMTFLSSF